MPLTYEIDPDAGYIQIRCAGEVTLQDVLAHLRELEADPKLPQSLDVLLDVAEQTSVPESAELRSVAQALRELAVKVRWSACAVVAHSDVLFGMGRVFQVFVEPLFAETRVFREREEAVRWLRGARSSPD